MPALLIYGDEDKNGTSENAEDLNRRLPNAQLHMLAGSGHFAITEREKDVFALIDAFIKDNPKSRVSS